MTNRNLFHILLSLAVILFNLQLFCSKIVKGDLKSSYETFSFKIGPYCFSTKDESYTDFQLYVGAGEPKVGKNFTISKLARSRYNPKDGFKFIGLCPEKIKTIHKKDPVANPLRDAKISKLSVLGEYPVVVKANDKKIYLLQNVGNDKDAFLYYSAEVNDASKKVASQILKLLAIERLTVYGSHIVAAVKGDKDKNFGAKDSDSGIALICINDNEKVFKEKNKKTNKEEETKIKYPELRLVNADASEEQRYQIKSNQSKSVDKKENKVEKIPLADNKAAPFNGSLAAIKINNDAEIVSNVIDMYWDKRLKCLYIAYSVKSGQDAGSGARAIVLCYINNDNKLVFEPIVSDSAIKNNNQIIATGIPNDDVSIQKIRTMHTSTLLSYLIVVGGNGAENQVGNKVYALPLVNKEREIKKLVPGCKHGSLAKFDQDPKCYFVNDFLQDKGRLFIKPAESPNDLLTNENQAAIVGFGDLPLKPNEKISDIFVVNDSVFVCIANGYNQVTQPGIFYSQAIFDSKGRICSWTKWTRTLGEDKKVKGAALDITKGQFWTIPAEHCQNVEVTFWGKNYADGLLGGPGKKAGLGLMSRFDYCFSPSQGGVQGLYDFSKDFASFNNFSMLIATGLKRVALIETGSLRNNFYRPTREDFFTDSLISSNGEVPVMTPNTKFALIMGGELDSLGSITQAEIAYNEITNESWIFVAGANGLAVLIDEHGKTWNGKIFSLNQIPSSCKFKKIGNYPFVNKIQSDGDFLYVLTNDRFDRIKISSHDFKTANIKCETIADASHFRNATFYDCGVSYKFALLATSTGLFRVGNGQDIRKNNSKTMNWTKVIVPESLPIISKLYFVVPSGKISDFALNGQVYVLSSCRSFNQTKLNRFIVDLNGEINDKTIEPIEDLFIKNKLSNFYDFGIFKENFWTDGALLFSSSSSDNEIDLYLHILAPKVLTGSRSFTVQNLPVDLDIIDKNRFGIFQIGKITRCSASGALLINGNFGLRTNE